MKNLVQILICLTTLFGSAQLTFTEVVIVPLQKDQLFFEKVFIHTNRTSYFINDNIWFKAYVGTFNNKPSLKTTRLAVNLLDEYGELIQNKNVFIYKGTGRGQFELNGSLKSGKYYIQAYTNYMRNFGDNNTFIQEINILNNIVKKEPFIKNQYDVQIFPEGGCLLEGVENIIGVKSLINGKGFDYSGTIVNSKNQKVANFNSEHIGMTKCKFFYKQKEKYTALININDTIFRKDIPMAKSKGVVFSVNKKGKLVNLTIKTNNNSLAEPNKKKYNLLIHQRNKIIGFLEIPRIDSLSFNLEFEKKSFFNGVNTFTLFENNKPILERKFYIEKQNLDVTISLKELNTEKDSINFKLKISNTNSNKSLKSNISISALPFDTSNFNETTNIKSAFLLTPYIKGYIENPAYYFNKKNSKRIEHIDLLLLTQGWSQYSREEMVKYLNPSYKYDFEIGFKLKGEVSPLLSNQLAMISKDNLLIDKLFLNGRKDFIFNDLLIHKGDTVRLSFLNNTNVAIKPKNICFDSIKVKTFVKFNPKYLGLKNKKKFLSNSKWEAFHDSNSEILNEVLVIGKKRNEYYYKKKELIRKYRHIVFDIGKYYALQLPNDYNDGLMSFLAFDQGIKLANWNGIENYLTVGVNKEAQLFIDGKQIKSEELSHISLSMEHVENIMMQPYKGNIFIQVFTTENYKKNISTLFKEYVFNDGYDKAKKYYVPVYDFNLNETINQTEIDWKPDLTTNDLGEVFFKIKKNRQLNSYLFSIQGFSENGFLISEIVKGY